MSTNGLDPRAAKILEMRRAAAEAPRCEACNGPLNAAKVCRRCHPERCVAPPEEKVRPEQPKLRVEPEKVVLPEPTPPVPVERLEGDRKPGPQPDRQKTAEKIKDMFLSGVSRTQIAKRLDLWPSNVDFHLKRLRDRGEIPAGKVIAKPQPDSAATPPTRDEAGPEPEPEPTPLVPLPEADGPRKRSPIQLVAEDLDRIRELARLGMGAGRISGETGYPASAVAYHLARMRQRGEILPPKAGRQPGQSYGEVRRTSANDLRRITELAGEGKTNFEIAEALGMHEKTVGYHVARLKERGVIPPPEPEAEPEPAPPRKSTFAPHPPEVHARIDELIREGVLPRVIAAETGASVSVIKRRRELMGLAPPPQGSTPLTSVDPEIAAMQTVLGVLRQLPPAGRTRVMKYVAERLEEKERDAVETHS